MLHHLWLLWLGLARDHVLEEIEDIGICDSLRNIAFLKCSTLVGGDVVPRTISKLKDEHETRL